MISASHNPFADNGIKFFSAQGTKLGDDWEREVEADAGGGARLGRLAPAWARRAGWTTRPGAISNSAKVRFPMSLTLRGLKIVVDGANGAAYQIAPKVFHELGAEVICHRLHTRRAEHQP